MKKTFVVVLTLLSFTGFCFAGSIILPFWQDEETPVYSIFIIMNTSKETDDQVFVMFYGKTGNPESGYYIQRTIAPRQVELFGTAHFPLVPKMFTSNFFGYAIATDTGGMLTAVGLVYDAAAHYGFPIECFPGDDGGSATEGW